MTRWIRPTEEVVAALGGTVPELPQLLDAAQGSDLYVVGGTVRDLLVGRGRTDLDIAVVGDAAEVAARLGGEVTSHERFGAATVALGAARIDLTSTRSEAYPEPGALPVVSPAGIAEDLARRDFSVNAMALPLGAAEPEMLDPHGGRDDLAGGTLRVLHDRSFTDDPTRAVRGARYGARFDLVPDEATAALLREADLGTVSEDRRRAELLRLTAEPMASEAIALLGEWGVVDLPEGAQRLAEKVAELMAGHPWSAAADRDHALLAVVEGELGRAPALAAAEPGRPSEAVELARGASAEELVIARALGASWVETYVDQYRKVDLEISGEDLVAAGVPEGPGVGLGLAEALRRKLDGEISGREAELEAALAAASR